MLRQHKQTKRLYSANYNASNIVFNDTPIKNNEINHRYQQNINLNNQLQNLIKSRNPGQSSVIGFMMNDKIEQYQSVQLRHYNNKIIPASKQYSVPKIQIKQPPRQTFKDIIEKRKKFNKPYADCTKYIDSLMKNKRLLRRGPNQIPIETTISRRIYKHQQSQTKNYQSKFHSASYFKKKQQIQKIPLKSTPNVNNLFDKTITGAKISYQHLINKQRSLKQSRVDIKNCMNRMLAAQLINLQLQKKGKVYTIYN